jgi:hypothetical protein
MAIKTNIVVDQGSTFSTVIYITDSYGDVINLDGYTGAAQMRKHYASVSKTDFTVAITGAIELSLSANTTANITPGRYLYDVEITKSGTVSRIVEGMVTVTPNITR